MNLSEVCAEVAAQLDTISGLRVFAYQPESIVPPAAWVGNPELDGIAYDQTYGRGMDRMTLPVFICAGLASSRPAQEAIRAYCDGSGARSVKAVLQAGTYTSLHTIRVMTGGVTGVRVAGTDYVGAVFDLDITGQGS